MDDKNWKVDVIDGSTGDVVRTIACKTERDAERVERGLLVNMNHDRYYTQVSGPEALS